MQFCGNRILMQICDGKRYQLIKTVASTCVLSAVSAFFTLNCSTWPLPSHLIRVLCYHWGLHRWSQTGCTKWIHYAKTKLESLLFLHVACYLFCHPTNVAYWSSDNPFKNVNSKSLDVRPVYVFTLKMICISVTGGKYESERKQTTVVQHSCTDHLSCTY